MTDKQHEQDLERVSGQNTFTDLTRHAEQDPSDGEGFLHRAIDSMVRAAAKDTPYARGMHGRTDFDNHRLNDMIDLVEETNPEDLESSGKALWDARDAITEAAKELDGHIENVHWVGESGEAFRKWGRSLVTSTYGLSDFAGGAGDQITAAAVGLAAVRKSMPPRDTRPDGKDLLPKQIPATKQVEGNADYAEAVRVEKDRQEAINQMNRLSSYYAVANQQLIVLQQEKTPEFTSMPDVGVPQPTPGRAYHPPAGAHHGVEQGNVTGDFSSRPTAVGTEGVARPQDVEGGKTVAQNAEGGRTVAPDGSTRPSLDPSVSVGTTIDSAAAPTVPTAASHGQTLPTSLPPAEGGVPTGPVSTGQTAPFSPARSSGRTSGQSTGLRSPLSAQGRTTSAAPGGKGVSGPVRQVGQSPLNQMGRTAPAGQPTAKGTTSGTKPISASHGVSGGTPRPAPSTTPKATGGSVTGAGRGNGVVGGRPGSPPGGAARGGTRIPRGTVVGAGAPSGSQLMGGRTGQRSGANGAVNASAKSPVTGTPAGRGSAAGAERNGMTRGGAGLVRGPGGRGKLRDEGEERETPRPEYLVEDEETHLPRTPRRDVPPVVN